ncbi:class I adenylate-forming enzyme family protein [Gracilimonas sp. BCB1]|uniref:class I adenylate-forming enzyme family protein n=1 Tax=Gracilimonas sp. BCB1 TaxID=3152362 RepID=UPI0032D95EA0
MESNSIVEGFFAQAESNPDKTAIIWKDEQISFAQVSENVRKVAGLLQREGVTEGDRVAFYGDKSPLFAYIYLATHLIKAVAVPLDVKLPEDKMLGLLDLTNPKLLIHPTNADHQFQQLPFDEKLLEGSAISEYDFPEGDQLADILFTTGTTGRAKGVRLTHRNILAGAVNSNIFIGNDESDTEIIPLPMHHAFGLRRLRTNLFLGATVILIDGFMFPKLFFDAIEEKGATGICMVPAGFAVLKKLMKSHYIDYFKKLKYIEFGSSPMSPEQKKELAENLPSTRICMHYGLTEVAANIFTEFHKDINKLSSVGQPSPNVQVSILGENNKELAATEVGEIAVKGTIQTPGYWENKELTQKSFTDGWFRTGDLGYKDKEGYVFLSGRKDDVINVGGKKVLPSEIEQALEEHPAVKDSACISVKGDQELTGEKIKAFVVFKRGEKIDSKELTKYLREKVEPYKIPQDFEFVAAIPYTSSGKKKRDQLK